MSRIVAWQISIPCACSMLWMVRPSTLLYVCNGGGIEDVASGSDVCARESGMTGAHSGPTMSLYGIFGGVISSKLRHYVSCMHNMCMPVETAVASDGRSLKIRTKEWRDTCTVCQSPVLCSVKSGMTIL